MGKKKEIQTADSQKRERRTNKEVAAECLQDGLNKVFKYYSAEEYLTVIVDSLKVSTANISKKSYADMGVQELLKEKNALLAEVSAIDKRIELLASSAPAPISVVDIVSAPAPTTDTDTISAPAPAKEEKK